VRTILPWSISLILFEGFKALKTLHYTHTHNISAGLRFPVDLTSIAGSLPKDDRLNRVLANIEQMVAALPALMAASDPFQSVSSLSNAQSKMTAYDFKSRLLLYYFNQHCPRLPPGLAQGQPLPSFRMQCMISKLRLDSKIVQAAHIVPKATNSSRVSFALTWKIKR